MVLVTDIKRVQKNGKELTGYYMQGYLAENLSHIPWYLNAAWDVVGIISGHGKVRIGKLQPNGSKVLMHNGTWKNIEEIKIGEKLISPSVDGKSSVIASVVETVNHKKLEMCEIRSSDKKKLFYKCCTEHNVPVRTLWIEKEKGKKRYVWKDEIYLAEELASKNEKWFKNHCPKIITAPVINNYSVKNFNMDPYFLGLYIGDGHIISTNRLGITNPEPEILKWLDKNYSVIRAQSKKNTNCPTIILEQNTEELRRLCGTGAYNKKIPREALTSDYDYRKRLFEGLLDTDAYVNKVGYVIYSSASEQLANDVLELAKTLGCRASIKTIYKNCQTFKEKRKYYCVDINVGELALSLNLLRKERLNRIRKVDLTENRNKENQYESIRVIKTSERLDGTCIQVDSESNLYITDNFSVTHNSTLAMQVGFYIAWLIAGGQMVFEPDEKKNPRLVEMKKPLRPVRFSLEENVVFNAEDLQDAAKKLYEKYGKNQVIVYDEGRQGLDSTRAMESINKGMQDFFQECGFMGHVILIVLPSFFKLHEDFAVARSLFLIDVFAKEGYQRGYFNFYNEHQKELLYFFGKKKLGVIAKYASASESFWGRFTVWLPFDKDEYEKKKAEAITKKISGRSTKKMRVQRDVLIWWVHKKFNASYPEIVEKLTGMAGVEITERTIEDIISATNDIIKRQTGFY